MRKVVGSIDSAKSAVEKLQGKKLRIMYNKGRNRVCFFNGVIDEVYPSVFMIKVNSKSMDRLSCSYSDVLMGDIRFKQL